MGFFENKNVLLIHDMWMPGFMYGDTDDWCSVYMAINTLNVKSLTIYIPYDISIYGETRYNKCIQVMGLYNSPNKYGDNIIIIDYNYKNISTIISNSDIIGLMAPLSHINDNELKYMLNHYTNNKYTFTQGEQGKYNRSASIGIDEFLNRAVPYKSNDTKYKEDGTNYTFEEISKIIPESIINNIMVPYKLYKLFCPPPLTNPYVPVLYLNFGTNICAIQELAVQMGVPNVKMPENITIVEQNNFIINALADFDLPEHIYSINNKPELNNNMKIAFTTMIYVARLFGMYESIDVIYNLSNSPPLKMLPPFNSFTNPMWDANTLILVNKII